MNLTLIEKKLIIFALNRLQDKLKDDFEMYEAVSKAIGLSADTTDNYLERLLNELEATACVETCRLAAAKV